MSGSAAPAARAESGPEQPEEPRSIPAPVMAGSRLAPGTEGWRPSRPEQHHLLSCRSTAKRTRMACSVLRLLGPAPQQQTSTLARGRP